MERTQVYLDAGQRARLAAIARQRGCAMALLVREALARYLEAETEAPRGRDPLLDLVGAAGDLERAADVARHHHRYLRTPHWKRRKR